LEQLARYNQHGELDYPTEAREIQHRIAASLGRVTHRF
jgi:hypothetical protein